MSAYANVGITYLNTKGQKSKAAAGAVFDDYREDDFDDWKERGWAREAKVGEIAEAKAAAEAKGEPKRAKPKAAAKPKKGSGDEDLA